MKYIAECLKNKWGLAEFVAVNSELVAKNTNSSFEEAAGLPLVGLTSIQALESVGIKENDRVLIHAGSGGVGILQFSMPK
jgi:NADPH:quinone reductase-like Zn-dependent oxidoreductase